MKVKELIAQLQMIEDQEATILIDQIYVNYVVCGKELELEDGIRYQHIWLYD